MVEFKKGYSRNLDDQFSIHIADKSEESLNSIINFNRKVHAEENIANHLKRILSEYPRRDDIYWLYIIDNKEGNIVSSLCLSPIDWQINNKDLHVCEMEFVGTLESYRNKGFIIILNELYEKIMEQENYLISAVRGIPYFYRNLGYGFTSSLDEKIIIQASKIPNNKYGELQIRKANLDDIALIKSKYIQFNKKFFISSEFNSECFKFKYINDKFDSEVRATYIFEENGVSTNFFSLGMNYDNKNYEILSPDLSIKEMNNLLQFIKNLGNYSDNDTIVLTISKYTSLFNYIKSLGGILLSDYGWQVKILNLKKFFCFFKEIIENRLKHSDYKELTRSIRISNYRETIRLEIKNGKIIKIKSITEYPDSEINDLKIPEPFLFKFLLGDKNIEEINYIIKDAIVNVSSKTLIKAIFPKKVSFFISYI